MAWLPVTLILFLGLTSGCFCLEESSEDQSINEIVDKEITPEVLNEHHYYLPQQTVFDSPGTVLRMDASKTSPPHINPTTTHDYEQVTEIELMEPFSSEDYIVPYSSYCVPETPSEANDESEILLPSQDLLQKSVVLSGYIETPSKTSDENYASKINNLLSISSDVGQDGKIVVANTSDI